MPDAELDLLTSLPSAPAPSAGAPMPPRSEEDILSSIPSPTDPVDTLSARKTEQSFVKINDTALASGQPLVAPRPDFTPHLAPAGSRNYLSDYTGRDLDLADNAVSPARLESEQARLLTQSPHLLAAFRAAAPADQQATLEHARSLALLNLTPASPKEKLSALSAGLQDWSKAHNIQLDPALANAASKILDAPFPIKKDFQDPELYAKARTAAYNQARATLPAPDQALLDASGGADLLEHLQTSLQPSVLLDRKSRLLGAPLRAQGAQAPSSLGFDDLAPISSTVRTLQANAQALAVRDAQATSDFYLAQGGGFRGSVALASDPSRALLSTDTNALGSVLGRAANYGLNVMAPTGMGAFDLALLHVPSTIYSAQLEAGKLAALNAGKIIGLASRAAQGKLLDDLKAGNYISEWDTSLIDQRIRATGVYSTMQLALHDPAAGRSASEDAAFLADNFSHLDDKSRLDLLNAYYPASSAARLAAQRGLGISSPALLGEVDALGSDAFEGVDSLVNKALGVGMIGSLLRGVTPRAMKDPKSAGSFTALEHLQVADRTIQPAALERRTALLDDVNREINRVASSDLNTARDFASRFKSVLANDDLPLTPERKAQALTSLKRLESTTRSLTGTTLSEGAKATLRDSADFIADLHPTDANFVLRGADVYTNPEGSLLQVKRAREWAEAQVEGLPTAARPRLFDRSPTKLAQMEADAESIATQRASINLNKSTLFPLLYDLQDRLTAEHAALTDDFATHAANRDAVLTTWHQTIAARATEALDLETKGGQRQVVNPALKSKSYSALAEAVRSNDPSALETVLRNRHLQLPGRDLILSEISELDAKQASELSAARQAAIEDLAPTSGQSRLFSAAGLRRLRRKDLPAFKKVLETNAPDLYGKVSFEKIIDSLAGQELRVSPAEAPVPKGLSSEPASNPLRDALLRDWANTVRAHFETPLLREIPASANPRTALHDKLQAKLVDAATSDKALTLTKDEMAFLNDNAAKLDKKPLAHNYPATLDALTADRDAALAARDAKQALLDKLPALLRDLDAVSLTNPKLALPKDLYSEISAELAKLPLEFDRKSLRFGPDLTPRQLSSLDAWHESIADLRDQERALERGAIKASSLDYALFQRANPRAARFALDEADRAARGLMDFQRVRAEIVAKKFGDLPEARVQEIFRQLKDGTPVDDVAVRLAQDQRLELLGLQFKEGAITADEYAQLSSSPYAHNLYTRAQNAELAAALDRAAHSLPPGYRRLNIDLDALKHKIPEKGEYYVLSGDAAHPVFKDGFETAAEAHSWISENLPPDSAVNIHKTMPIAVKQAIGINGAKVVGSAAASHLDLVRGMALDLGRTLISRFWAETPYVKRLSDIGDLKGALSDDGSLLTEPDGTRWTRWSGGANPFLDGKFVHPEVYKWFDEMGQHYDLSRSVSAGFADASRGATGIFVANPLARQWAAAIGKVGEKVGQGILGKSLSMTAAAFSRTFTLAKIPLSYLCTINNWVDNFNKSWTLNVNPFSASSLKATASYLRDYFSSEPLRNPELAFLSKHNLIELADKDAWRIEKGASHAKIIQTEIDKHYNSLSGLQSQIDTIGSDIAEALDKNNTERATSLRVAQQQLQDQLNARQKDAAHGLSASIGRFVTSAATEINQLAQGKGKTHSSIYSAYNHLTGDIATKVIMARKLLVDDHLPEAEAARIIGDYTQQLHRVPAAVQQIGQHPLGALYPGYIADQFRILTNVSRNPSIQLNYLRNAISLGAFNYGAISSQGTSVEDYLNTQAMRAGQRRTALTDAATLLGSLHVPFVQGDYSMQVNALLGGALSPQSPLARALVNYTHHSTDDPYLRTTLDALTGAASKYAGSSLPVNVMTGMLRGTDEKGDPINTLGDFVAYLGRGLAPPGAASVPLTERGRRLWSTGDIDLHTGRPISLPQSLAAGLNIRPDMRSTDRFRSALYATLRAGDPNNTFRREQAEDDLASTEVARGARRPDGTYDPAKARDILREHFAANPKYRSLPGEDKVIDPVLNDRINRLALEYRLPADVRSFKHLSLEDKITVYAKWLSVDPRASASDPDFYKSIWRTLYESADSKHVSPDEARALNTVIQSAEATGLLPAEARSHLHAIAAAVHIK